MELEWVIIIQSSRIIRGKGTRNIGAYNNGNNFFHVCSFANAHSSLFTPNLYKSLTQENGVSSVFCMISKGKKERKGLLRKLE
jgi:hypothetical protein